MTANFERHVFTIVAQIAGAKDPAPWAKRVYDSAALADVLLGGPGSDGVFDLDFDREGASFEAAVERALKDVDEVLPEAELVHVLPERPSRPGRGQPAGREPEED